MRVRLFDSIQKQLQQFAEEINRTNEENETLDYMFRQGHDESTSLKGDDYKNIVHNLFGGRGSQAVRDIKGTSKRERYQTKAQEREKALQPMANNIAETIANAELEHSQLETLQQQVAELKNGYDFKQTKEALDRLYQPIVTAISSELQQRHACRM